MSSITVRVSEKTGAILRELAGRAGEPMQAILDRAVEEYRRKRFLEEANQAYALLRSNPKAWAEESAERKAWDKALGDDLEREAD